MYPYFRFTLGFLLATLSLRAADQEIAFIVHPQVAETSLSADDLSNILLGKKTSWNSGSIKLIVLQDGPIHESVTKTYLQRSADQFDKHWKKLVFTGKGIMPTPAKSEAEMLDLVAKTPGAIGYVAKASATSAVKPLVIQ